MLLEAEQVNASSPVKQVGDSEVFHITRPRFGHAATGVVSICGAVSSYDRSSEVTEWELAEAFKEGLRPCQQCVAKVSEEVVRKLRECQLCGRINVAIEADMSEVEISHTLKDNAETYICDDCVGAIRS